MAETLLPPRVLDEDAAHRLGRCSEEMPPTFPAHLLIGAQEPQAGFVNQCRGLQRLPGLLLSEFLSSQLAKLVIHQRQELLRGVRVALLDGGQDVSDFGHDRRLV